LEIRDTFPACASMLVGLGVRLNRNEVEAEIPMASRHTVGHFALAFALALGLIFTQILCHTEHIDARGYLCASA